VSTGRQNERRNIVKWTAVLWRWDWNRPTGLGSWKAWRWWWWWWHRGLKRWFHDACKQSPTTSLSDLRLPNGCDKTSYHTDSTKSNSANSNSKDRTAVYSHWQGRGQPVCCVINHVLGDSCNRLTYCRCQSPPVRSTVHRQWRIM